MLAEEELNSIFSKSKKSTSNSTFNSNSGLTQWNAMASSFSTNTSNKTSDSLNQATISNFDYFEVPFERPSCNPFTKIEEFTMINYQEETEFIK